MTGAGLIVAGANDAIHLREGWFDLERDPRCGVRYRWTAPEASFELELPDGATGILMLVAGVACLMGRPVPLSLYAGGKRLAHAPAAALLDAWTPVRFPVAGAGLRTNRLWTLRVETVEPGTPEDQTGTVLEFVPDRDLSNGDFRRLGIQIAAIRAVA